VFSPSPIQIFFRASGAVPFAVSAKGGDFASSEVCSLGGGDFSPHVADPPSWALAPEESFQVGAASFAPFATAAGFSKRLRRPEAFALRGILSCFLVLGALPFAVFAKGGAFSPSEVCSLGGGDFSPHAEAMLSRALAPEESFLFSSTNQEPGQPPPPQATPTPSSSSKHPKQKYSHANDFLIRGTVFTDKALAFPGVQLRIRRASEKKFRWQDATNSRGEFAMRVPQGAQYEVVVHAKGFADQSKTIDAKKGLTEERLVFTLEPQAAKKGAKK
jgi:hypothetical protein